MGRRVSESAAVLLQKSNEMLLSPLLDVMPAPRASGGRQESTQRSWPNCWESHVNLGCHDGANQDCCSFRLIVPVQIRAVGNRG